MDKETYFEARCTVWITIYIRWKYRKTKQLWSQV